MTPHSSEEFPVQYVPIQSPLVHSQKHHADFRGPWAETAHAAPAAAATLWAQGAAGATGGAGRAAATRGVAEVSRGCRDTWRQKAATRLCSAQRSPAWGPAGPCSPSLQPGEVKPLNLTRPRTPGHASRVQRVPRYSPRRGRDASKGHAQTLPLRSAERRRGTAGRVRGERGSRHRDPSPAPHEGLVTWMARPSGAAAGPPTSLQYSCGRPPPPAAASPQVAVAQMLAAAARLKYGGWRLSPIPREPGSSGCARQKVRSGETRAHSSGEPGAAVILRRALPSPLPGRLYSCGGREAGPGEGGEAVRELPAPPREGRREKGMGKGPRCVPWHPALRVCWGVTPSHLPATPHLELSGPPPSAVSLLIFLMDCEELSEHPPL